MACELVTIKVLLMLSIVWKLIFSVYRKQRCKKDNWMYNLKGISPIGIMLKRKDIRVLLFFLK